jgi:hypothetical protein
MGKYNQKTFLTLPSRNFFCDRCCQSCQSIKVLITCYRTVNVLTFSRHFNLLTFNKQQTEVIFKPLALNAVKFLPAVND